MFAVYLLYGKSESGYDRLPPSFITFRYAREKLLINVTITFIICKTHPPVKVGNMAGNLSTTGGGHAVADSPLRAVSPLRFYGKSLCRSGVCHLPESCFGAVPGSRRAPNGRIPDSDFESSINAFKS